MELFLPSLMIMFIAIILVFTVIPRFSPFIIFIICCIFLIISLYSHYKLFSKEYRNILYVDSLKDSTPITIQYTSSSSISIIFAFIIFIGVAIATLNLFKNISFFKISFNLPTKTKSAETGYKNIPVEKIIELERQL